MKKMVCAAMLLLCVCEANAQRAEFGVKLGGLANYDVAFYNDIVPMAGIAMLFRPGGGPFQLGPVAELGIDGNNAIVGVGPDFNFLLKLGKYVRLYPGMDMRLMAAYSDVGFSLGAHAGVSYRVTGNLSLNAEAGPRLVWFNAFPGNNYLVGSGTIGLRFGM